MAILRPLTYSNIHSLYPHTLYRLGQAITKMRGVFNLPSCPLLAKLDPQQIIIERKDEALFQAYENYTAQFKEEIRKVDSHIDSSDDDFIIAALLDDLRRCTSEEILEKLEQLASSRVPYKSGYDTLEYGVRIFLCDGNSETIRRAVQMVDSQKKKAYFFYQKEKTLLKCDCSDPKLEAEFEHRFKELILEDLKKFYGTQICMVRMKIHEEKWYIEVLHGGRKQKNPSEKNAEAKDVLIQPLQNDLIIFDTLTHDVRVHMDERRLKIERDAYLRAFSDYLTSGAVKWKLRGKFDLNVFALAKEELITLMESAEANLTNDKLGRVQVKLTSITYIESVSVGEGRTPASRQHIMTEKVEGLIATLARGEFLIPHGCQLESVTIVVSHGWTKKHQKTIVIKSDTMTCPSFEGFEDWLASCGVINMPVNELAIAQDDETRDIQSA